MVGVDGSFKPTRDSRPLGGSQIFGSSMRSDFSGLTPPTASSAKNKHNSSRRSQTRGGLSGVTKYWNRSCSRDDAKNEVPTAQRSFAQPTACLHVPAQTDT